jgi:uncharacterized protein DUF4340
MRGLKSTLALIVVLIGLGCYIYFVTWKQDDSATSKQEKVFAGLSTDKIDQLSVKSESGDTTSVKKTGDAWRITAPIDTKASESDVVAVNAALGQLEVTRVIDENPTNLKEFGLDPPKIEIDFKASDGKSGKLLVGEKNATGASLYAKRNDEKRVFLIAQYQETALNKSTFDLRDKAVMALVRDKIDGMEAIADGKSVQFAKSGSDWKMVKPIAARADFSAVEGVLSRVENAQMKSVVTSNATPADLKTYGLDKPAVTINMSSGNTKTTFEVGGKASDDTVYARDAGSSTVVTVEKAMLDDLKKGVDDYRKHDIFESRAFSTTHIEITRGGQKLVLDRVKAAKEGDADSWKRASPNPGDADKEKVNKALADMADINATAFQNSTAKTGLDTPVMVVDLKFDDGKKEEKLTFGKNGNDIYASRPDEPGAIKVDASKFNDTAKEFDELSK